MDEVSAGSPEECLERPAEALLPGGRNAREPPVSDHAEQFPRQVEKPFQPLGVAPRGVNEFCRKAVFALHLRLSSALRARPVSARTPRPTGPSFAIGLRE